MACTAKQLIDQARSWIGCNEKDGSFKKIIDTYNSHKPYARGFKMDYKTAWCDCFVSACAIACNAVDLIGTEVGCERHVDIFKQKGIWIEDESITPKAGDIVLYDWQDSGAGDNKGWSDHIGIVESVSGSMITVIEGNNSDAVRRRTIGVNSRYLRGYARPKYTASSTPTQPTIEKKAYSGTWPTLPKKGYFAKKDKGVNVQRMQAFLLWYNSKCLPKYGADGSFGSETDAAVRAYQKAEGLEVDGQFGPKSLAKAKTIKK